MNVKDGLVAIASEVLGDAQKEAEALILKSEAEAKEVLLAAKSQAEHEYMALVGQAKVEAESEKRRLASLTELEIRNHLLQTKEELVEAAFQRAIGQLKEFVETDKYKTYLLALISGTAVSIGSKKLVLKLNAKDKVWLTHERLKNLSKKLKINFELSTQTADSLGGFIIQTEDAKVTYDSRIENLLNELKPTLRPEVATILFEEET
ncbi:MAG: V-type ATP synthase subunit E [Ignavibacteria bacterium]